jgi:O-antigen ligase
MFINTGQTYYNYLIPPGIFPIQQYPEGYVLIMVISYVHIFSLFGMIPIIIYDFIKRQISLKFSALDITIFSYYVWVVISNIVGSNNPFLSSAHGALSLYPLIGYFFFRLYSHQWKEFRSVLVILTIAILSFETILCFIQFYKQAPIGNSLEEQQGMIAFGEAIDELPFQFRPLGTFWHPNELASFLSFVVPFLSSIMIVNRFNMLATSLVGGIIVMILTLSRSGWLAFGGSFLILSVYWIKTKLSILRSFYFRKLIFICIITLPFLMGFFVFPRLEKSINILFSIDEGGLAIRQFQMENSLLLIGQHPFFGVGTKMSVIEGLDIDPLGVMSYFPSAVHNRLLLMAVENGIPALLLFSTFQILVINKLIISLRNKPLQNASYDIGLLSAFIGVNIIGIFQPFLPIGLMLLYAGSIQNNKHNEKIYWNK